MTNEEGLRHLELAERHLERVQAAWDRPTDWDDLSIYGLYCVEAAARAAAEHAGLRVTRDHRAKSDVAERLADIYGLPAIADLMPELNMARKAAAYGDTAAPDLDAEDVAGRIEEYVDAVAGLYRGRPVTVSGSRPSSGALASIRRWPSPQAKNWMEQFLEWAMNDQSTRIIVAIGSAVRDVERTVDLDLLIANQGAVPTCPTPPIDVDLRYFSVDQLEALALRGHDLVGWAIMYGAPILDKDGYWRLLIHQLSHKVPLPSKEASLERARRARRLTDELLEAGDEDAAGEQLLSFLTHLARATLTSHRLYPRSRPELVPQLRSIGERTLANALDEAISARSSPGVILRAVEPLTLHHA